MGCSATKNSIVEPIGNDKKNSRKNLNKEVIKVSNTDESKSSSSVTLDVDIQPGKLENAMANNVQKAGNGMSFEITFDENEGNTESIIQKHPPKRIFELKEAETREAVTLEKLQEKLDEAEIRRQQILQQRIQSANLLKRLRNNKMLESVQSEIKDEQSPHYLTVPLERPLHPNI